MYRIFNIQQEYHHKDLNTLHVRSCEPGLLTFKAWLYKVHVVSKGAKMRNVHLHLRDTFTNGRFKTREKNVWHWFLVHCSCTQQ